MTYYFDNKHEVLRKLEPRLHVECVKQEDHDALQALERTVVDDCSVAAGFPGFPEDLRDAVDRTVLKHGVTTQPLNAPSSATEDVDTMTDHVRRVHQLIWDLHTVFHEVSQRGLEGFTDSPLSPVNGLAGLAEARREELASKMPGAKAMRDLFGQDGQDPVERTEQR